MEEVLHGTGFEKTEKSLFIWEGVTCYLLPSAVDETLRFIRSCSPPGSQVCFDYHTLSDGMSDKYGVKEIAEFMKTHNPEEPMRFGIVEGEIESFLAQRGFGIIDNLDAKDMERRYLTLPNGSSVGRVPALHYLVRAVVNGF